MEAETGTLVLIGITCFAAFVNGALGYGFSSLTVPVALLFVTNRVLNPALVLIEVFINVYVLVINRASIPAVWKRAYPIIIGLLPGIALGSYLLASVHPGWTKFATYAFLLPLILVQAAACADRCAPKTHRHPRRRIGFLIPLRRYRDRRRSTVQQSGPRQQDFAPG
jgi:uncharacterized membrane protein YfcA